MLKHIQKLNQKIFVIDDMYDEIDQVEAYIKKGSSRYEYHSGDKANMFTSNYDHDHNMEHLIDDYCFAIQTYVESIFSTKLKEKSHISAIIYPVGGRKGYHVDNYHKDADGIDHDIHVFSAVHFVEQPKRGGELHFPDLDIKIDSKRNRMVVFDAKLLHGSMEVIEGQKISVNYFWEVE